MAYAERRPNGTWRVRFTLDGKRLSRSGFATRQAALEYGQDVETLAASRQAQEES